METIIKKINDINSIIVLLLLIEKKNPAKSLIFVTGAQVCRRGMASVGMGVRRRLGRVHESAAWVRESTEGVCKKCRVGQEGCDTGC